MVDQRWGEQTRQDDAQSGREAILAAARTCYDKKGIAGTTLGDIAREARISRRTVYRYFENKGAIIQAIVDEQAMAFLHEMQQALHKDTDDFPTLLKQYMIYLVTKGPQAPGHQLLLGDKNVQETRRYYFSSPVITGMWQNLMQKPFEKAQADGTIRPSLAFSDLTAWAARIVYSFIQSPVDKKTLSRLLDEFVIAAITP